MSTLHNIRPIAEHPRTNEAPTVKPNALILASLGNLNLQTTVDSSTFRRCELDEGCGAPVLCRERNNCERIPPQSQYPGYNHMQASDLAAP